MRPYYSDRSVTIYHCDYRLFLAYYFANIEDYLFDLVLTDPPFGAETHNNAKSNRGKGHRNKAIDFESVNFQDIKELFWRCGPHVKTWFISFMEYRHIAKLEQSPPPEFDFVRFGVWVKTNPMPQISADRPAHGWDGIAYLHKQGVKKKWSGGGNHGNYIGPTVTDGLHPTQKPLGFLQTTVQRFTEPGNLVFDPFMGSGTTLLAAKNMGRRAIGCDISEIFCEAAAKRMMQEVMEFG